MSYIIQCGVCKRICYSADNIIKHASITKHFHISDIANQLNPKRDVKNIHWLYPKPVRKYKYKLK